MLRMQHELVSLYDLQPATCQHYNILCGQTGPINEGIEDTELVTMLSAIGVSVKDVLLPEVLR